MKWFSTFSVGKSLAWLMASLLAAVVAGCGGGGGGGDAAPAPGTLGVSLTDTPACGFDEVNVTVLKVRVHQSSSAADTDAGWTDITLNPPRKINLLDLNNGVLENLGETPLTPGHYTQLRLVLDANTTAPQLRNSVLPSGVGMVETPLVTPSAVQSGIKLINQFDVESGKRVDLVLDFDACKSVVTRGNGTYALKPVVRVIPTELNGVSGFVDATLVGSNAMVTAQQNGTIVQTTAPKASGEFFLARLPVGTYDIVFTADGRATAVITGVPITSETSVANLSSLADPVVLPTSDTRTISGTAVLNPVSTTVDAFVAAKQTFGVAPAPTTTVTVKSVAADDGSTPPGAYSMTLPIAAPLLGAYSATLPISLTAQGSLAGKYAAEASATGYVTQSFNKDIATTNQTQNFTLVPTP